MVLEDGMVEAGEIPLCPPLRREESLVAYPSLTALAVDLLQWSEA